MKQLVIIIAMAVLLTVVACGGHDTAGTAPALNPDAALTQKVAALPAPDGVDTQIWSELQASLAGKLAARQDSSLKPAVPTGAAGQISDLQAARLDDNTGLFTWTYFNCGDYNQDGLVSIHDLAPIGHGFGACSESLSWISDQLADGNGDGMITASDVTAIGQNYMNRVDGYLLQESATPGNEDSWQAISVEPLSAARFEDEGWHLVFNLTATDLKYMHAYRVTPYIDLAGTRLTGTGSNQILWAQVRPTTVTGVRASDGDHTDRIRIEWEPAHPVPADYYIVYRDAPDNAIAWVTDATACEECVTSEYSLHEYWVRGGNICGLSDLSAGDTGFAAMVEPVGLAASQGAWFDRVQLEWEPVDGAGNYEIFRDAGNTPVAVTEDTVWADTETDTLLHSYRVRAANLLGHSSLSTEAVGFKRSTPGGGWKQAGGNAQHTNCSGALSPEAPNVKWTKYFNNTAHSSPALSNDQATVYAASRDGRIHAFSRISHEHLWSFNTGAPVTAQPVVNAEGQILAGNAAGQFYCLNTGGTEAWHSNLPGPVTDRAALAANGSVYVASTDGTLSCLNPGGRLHWAFTCAGPAGSHPAVHTDGNAYVIAGSNSGAMTLHAVDPLGNERWSDSSPKRLYDSPALDADGNVYVSQWDDSGYNLARLNPAGEVDWRCDLGDEPGCTPVVSTAGMVYIANHWPQGGFFEQMAELHAINPDGTHAWTAGRDSVGCDYEVLLGPYGNIYLCNHDSGRALECYSPAGIRLWYLDDDVFQPAENSIPVLADDGMVCVTDYDRGLLSYVPNAGDPEDYLVENADTHQPAYITGEPVFAGDGTVYLGGDVLRALDPGGDVLWSAPQYDVNGAAVDENGFIYASGEYALTAYDAFGARQWELSAEDESTFDRAPVLAGGLLYFRSGTVIHAADGSVAWKAVAGGFTPPAVSGNGLSYWINHDDDSNYILTALNAAGGLVCETTVEDFRSYRDMAVDSTGRLLLQSTDNLIVALDAWLDPQWRTACDLTLTTYSGISIARNDAIYVSAGQFYSPSYLAAMDPAGNKLWLFEHPDMAWTNIVVDDAGCVCFGDRSGMLYSVYPDGTPRWQLQVADKSPLALSLSPDGTLYVTGPYRNLIAIGPED